MPESVSTPAGNRARSPGLVASPVPTVGANNLEQVARSCLVIAYSSCPTRYHWHNPNQVTIFSSGEHRSLT